MKIDTQNCSLIIAGSWNPAILNDARWFARTILDHRPGEQFNVNLEMQVAAQAINKLTFLGVSFIASPSVLMFFINPSDPEAGKAAMRASRKILEVLTHTPVTGIGFNFQFRSENPTAEFLGKFPIASDLDDVLPEHEIVSKSWQNKIAFGNQIVTADCLNEGGAGIISLNMHNEVQSAASALNVLDSDAFVNTLARAKAITEMLSNEAIEENE